MCRGAGFDSIKTNDMLCLHAVPEGYCSYIHTPDGKVGRNMDFYPAKALGDLSIVFVNRLHKYHYLHFGWPGFLGCVTAINENGIMGSILLNESERYHHDGYPVMLRLEKIMRNAATLDDCLKMMDEPTGSPHYIVFSQGKSAILTYHTDIGLKVEYHHGEQSGNLTITNKLRNEKLWLDPRRKKMKKLLDQCHQKPTMDDVTQIMASVAIPGINSQVMYKDGDDMYFGVGTSLREASLSNLWKFNYIEVLQGRYHGEFVNKIQLKNGRY